MFIRRGKPKTPRTLTVTDQSGWSYYVIDVKCHRCGNTFLVAADDADDVGYCPFCGKEISNGPG